MNPQTASQAIEYPKLKKVGGFGYGVKKIIIKYLIIIIVSGLIASFTGYTVQNSFRNIIGINKTEEVVIETTETAPAEEYKGDNVLAKFTSSLEKFTEDLKNSDIVKKINEASVNVLLNTFKPVLNIINRIVKFLESASFWVPFILLFMISAWFINKIISAKEFFADSTNPQVIENIETLEAKIKELVDNANNTNNK